MNEILQMINKNDYRSAVSWCKRNDVDIYKDTSGRYVIAGEFNLAYNSQLIERYKTKYGNGWEMMFELCANNKLYSSTFSDTSQTADSRYKPLGNASANFSKKLND